MSELFDPNTAYTAPAGAHLTYRGGPLLTHVKLFGIAFDDFSFPTEMSGYLNWLVGSDVLGELAEYNTGLGSFSGMVKLAFDASTPPPGPPPPPPPGPPPPGPGSLEQCILDCFQAAGYSVHRVKKGIYGPFTAARTITDAQIQSRLSTAISNKEVPAPDSMTVYAMFFPSGTVIDLGTDASCQTFCGYHDSFTLPDGTAIYYAVLPFPDCAGCTGGMAQLDALTSITSHEVCEAITDPVPGSGWYDDTNGEVGDICAWQTRQDSGYTVQLEWSNQHNSCI